MARSTATALRAIVGIALLFAGCAIEPSPTPSTSASASDPLANLVPATAQQIEGLWLFQEGSVDGVPVPQPARTRTTIAFIDDGIGGETACNGYGGHLRFIGGVAAVEEITQTMMGCANEREVSERTYIAAVRAVTRIWMDGDELVLTGPHIRLRYTRLPEVQTGGFVDREWILDTMVRDGLELEPSRPASLQLLSDGTFSGGTGCRTFTGNWATAGDHIVATAIDMAGECPADLRPQDDQVIGVIGRFFPTIEGDRLTLTTVAGDALIYRLVTD